MVCCNFTVAACCVDAPHSQRLVSWHPTHVVVVVLFGVIYAREQRLVSLVFIMEVVLQYKIILVYLMIIKLNCYEEGELLFKSKALHKKCFYFFSRSNLNENIWIWNTYGWIVVIIDDFVLVYLVSSIWQLLLAVHIILVLNDHHGHIGICLGLRVILRLMWYHAHWWGVKWRMNLKFVLCRHRHVIL